MRPTRRSRCDDVETKSWIDKEDAISGGGAGDDGEEDGWIGSTASDMLFFKN